ncbi:hypothetical protein GCM10023321_58500 [Pseudonocardia eucalypti]|uniref:DUF721 domain-containing protein n=1 Tax=Pseudonocardia eucalypti TaxID=648755 RepID=A0ABP9QSF7_9PSEU|nr:hypothetical protein [Pseudonocardia eucalypti]
MALDNLPRGWPGPDGSEDVDHWRIREIRQLWREACEVSEVCQWIPTVSGWTRAIPAIGQVTLGHPTVMIVQLRTGQRPEHLQAAAPQIARDMHLGEVRVTPIRERWVRVELLAVPKPPTRLLPPTRPTTLRRGPSGAWTKRLHPWRLRKPEQPS